MDLLLEYARHLTDLQQLILVLLQHANNAINLAGFLLILIVQKALLGH